MVAILIPLSVWGLFARPRSTDLPPELMTTMAEKLRTSPDDLCPELLSTLENRLPKESVQVFFAQGVPGDNAIILAVPLDSSEEEQATHWPAPWLCLSEVLAQGPCEPQQAFDRRQGVDYVHHIYPVDASEKRYLVVTTLHLPSTTRRILPWLGLGCAVLLVGLLLRFRSTT